MMDQYPRTPDPWGPREGEQQASPTPEPYGQTPYSPPPPGGSQPGSGAAIASLVLGIVGFFFAGIILGIIGLVMASKAKQAGYTGGIRTAGFVLSLLALILGVISTILIVVIVGVGIAAYL